VNRAIQPPTTNHQPPEWSAPHAILYDHDGTLVNSLPVVVEATNAALVMAGYSRQPAEVVIKAMVLPTGPRMGFHSGSNDLGVQAALAAAFYREANLRPHLASAYPGVHDLLAAVHRRGVPQGVISNNEGVFVRRVVTALGLMPFLGPVLGEEDVPAPKPDPRGLLLAAAQLGVLPDQCWYVGDAPPDLAAARGAGMTAIGVTWGIHTRTEMEALGFDRLIDHPAALLEMLG